MRIIQIVPSIAAEASGPSYTVVSLCRALGEVSNDVWLMTVGAGAGPAFRSFRHITYPQDYVTAPLASRLCLSKALARALDDAAADADILHNHGLWLMPNIYPARAAAKHDKPLVVSPRGTLAKNALKFSPHAKRLFWALLQGPAMRRAACLHATSEQEYRDIRSAGLRQPVVIIPNGIDLPAATKTVAASTGMRTLLYLGRLHPIKGIDLLLRAWRRVADTVPDWRLRIVGPAEGNYRNQLENLTRQLSLPRTEFSGPRYGQDKTAEYLAAELSILPSQTENFGMSAAESLAHGTPVITTTGTPWDGVVGNGCGWFVAPEIGAIETALRDALALDPVALAGMGQAGRDWMARDFAWPQIGKRMEAAYAWLTSGGAVPDTVRCN